MFSWLNYRIGFFLAVRQIKRASIWTNVLITFVMVLTFLNLVVVSGILVGLIQGAVDAVREHYISDVIITNLNNKEYIENSPAVINLLKKDPRVSLYTARYSDRGTVEADYKTRIKETDKANITSASFAGIDPIAEEKVTHLSKFIVEGKWLSPGDYDQVVLGSYLLKKYLPIESPGFVTLSGDIRPGTKVRIAIGNVTREVTVKGIVSSKIDEVNMRIFMVDSQLRSLIGRNDFNVDEISIELKPGFDPATIRDSLLLNGVGSVAKVQTFDDASPKFIKDMITTFAILGNIFSSLGLVVAAITIFIVIFINAITRRKFIGILKGIGISGEAIEISYIFQSFFYAIMGSVLGLLIVYGILQPYIAANPINFPFSDGILVAPVSSSFFRLSLLVLVTIISGYIPARMIVKKNTLDSILGRN
ncbi:MAG: FtsX-like permease family protein [Candidatus Paceibacterota bacterium]|jgi:ABC-type lipoprotein release transport system permease subunit